jgi:endonuclease V-like protein UPF0215 family
MSNKYAHIIGIDDAPFPPNHRGDVTVVGAVFADLRLEGVVYSKVRRDGVNSTTRLAEMILDSHFAAHLQLVLLQGIAVAGFNVVDIRGLAESIARPVLVVARRSPDMASIRHALLGRVPGGRKKWRLLQAAGEMEAVDHLFVQRAGIELADAAGVIRRLALSGYLPEPLRVAHLIAGGLSPIRTRQRP